MLLGMLYDVEEENPESSNSTGLLNCTSPQEVEPWVSLSAFLVTPPSHLCRNMLRRSPRCEMTLKGKFEVSFAVVQGVGWCQGTPPITAW